MEEITSHLSWDNYPIPPNLPPVVINDASFPLVSIVTPSYNQGRFIRETITSVLLQDYPNIEYWVIDGGSTDDTVSILREYEQDTRFHWISEKDDGQSDAINKGWSRCRGDIVAWLNSDDVYTDSNVVSQQQEQLNQAAKDALVYGDCVFTDGMGKILGKFPAKQFSYYTFLRACHIPQPSVFLTRSLMDKVGTINVSLRYAMDYDYWLRCATHCAFQYNKHVIATYRLHAESKTVSSSVYASYEAALLIAASLCHLQDKIDVHLRKKVLSGAMLAISAAYARNGQLARAMHHARYAFRLHKCDQRWLFVFLAMSDYCTNGKLRLGIRGMDLLRKLSNIIA